jgi:DNA-binding IclR family transcriptional regulator
MRNGIAEWFRCGESKMRMVAMIGTELTASATAMGRSSPSADSILLHY